MKNLKKNEKEPRQRQGEHPVPSARRGRIDTGIERAWHLIDVDGKILGRIATYIAELLMGKRKPTFVRYKDIGDYVVVINSAKVKVTGRKEQQKAYIHHTGYPGGFRKEFLWRLRQKDPRQIIIHAVKGMLPNNRLKDQMLKRLYVFSNDKHPFEEKIKGK